MAWTKRSNKGVAFLDETYTLPSSAVREYSSVIVEMLPDPKRQNRYISVAMYPSAITGSDLDIALYGSVDRSGTDKFQLVDAVLTDLTVDATWVVGLIDLNAYPAPFYFLAWLPDVNESANTIRVIVMG